MATAEQVVEALGGERVLKKKVRTWDELREQVEAGLPTRSLNFVAAAWSLHFRTVLLLLARSERTMARRKGQTRLDTDESDRLARFARVATRAEEVLGAREKASRWLAKPNRALAGKVPLQLLSTDIGAREVEDLLGRIEHGVY